MKKDLSIMIKPASSKCNLQCKYCFYNSVAVNRDCADFGIMNAVTTQNIVKNALEFACGGSIYFAFQGGEPLIAGLAFFENFVSSVNLFNTRNSQIVYAVQTNGTLINDKWAQFFATNRFLVGLSLDGDRNANKFRTDSMLNYSFTAVFEKIELLKSFSVDFNILIVATSYTATHTASVYQFFVDNGCKHLQFIPCLRPFKDTHEKDNDMFMTPEQYATFLITLFNLYVKDYVRGNYVSVRQLDNFVALYLGKKVELCGASGHCSHQFVFEGNGNVYPCDFYCNDSWLLGNINDMTIGTIAHSEKANAFIKESFDRMPTKCLECKYFNVCRGGGCKRQRLSSNYCNAYLTFFSTCAPLFNVFNSEKN